MAAAACSRSATDQQYLIVFSHGAGASSSSNWMVDWTSRLASSAACIRCHAFDFEYIKRGGGPGKAERHCPAMWQAARDALAKVKGRVAGIIFAGKSMGSRVGCIALSPEYIPDDVTVSDSGTPSLQGVPVCGVMAFGYPLKGGNKALRTGPLTSLPVPMLFFTGTKDAMGPLTELRAAIKTMPCSDDCKLFVVETGDHSLRCQKTYLKTSGQSQEDIFDAMQAAAADFAARATLLASQPKPPATTAARDEAEPVAAAAPRKSARRGAKTVGTRRSKRVRSLK
jgi:predicted alpha/beta-hydrolase family hydrolase